MSTTSKEYVLHFNHLALTLLTERERDELHKSLRHYQRYTDIPRLAKTINRLLNTPEKQKLLAYIRAPMTRSERDKFDRLVVADGPSTMTMAVSSRPASLGRITTPPGSSSAAERHVTIYGSRGGSMGFSIRGGSEFGLGIYVSNVRGNTPSAEADLRIGDHVLSANGVDLTCAANSSAVKVLSSSALLNLRVVRTGKVPEWKVARERVLWYDVSLCRVVATPPVSDLSNRSSHAHSSKTVVERKVVISVSQDSDFIGLNVRGGKEYGVGIYVSRVDAGGLASKVGLAPGDQIVIVNGTEFLSINHTDAVDVLRSSTHLIITIRSVGKYPVYKELFAEYTWSDGSSHTTKKIQDLGPNTGGGRSKQHRQRTEARESSVDLHPYAVSDHGGGIPNNAYDEADILEELDDGLAVQHSVLCYPEDRDIMFRRQYENSWQQTDAPSTADQHADPTSSSWVVDHEDSLGHYHTQEDSDLSDNNVDYLTFLEHNRRREEHRKMDAQKLRPSSSSTEFRTTTNGDPVIETEIEEQVTEFPSMPRPSKRTISTTGSDVFVDGLVTDSNLAPSQVYAQFPDSPTLERKNFDPRSSDSSAPSSPPIYASVNKTSGSVSSSSRTASVKSNRAPEPPGVRGDASPPPGLGNGYDAGEDYSSELRRLQVRQSHLGSWEINRVAGVESMPSSPEVSEYGDSVNEKNKRGTWTSIKNKLKGSLRIKGQKKRSSLPYDDAYQGSGTPSGSVRQKGIFDRSPGSQILNAPTQDRYNLMGMLEDHARGLLNEDESKAVMRRVHNYHESKDLNRLVEMLFVILDKPEKRLLLVDVRGVIAPNHVPRYDSLVEQCSMIEHNKLISAEALQVTAEPNPPMMRTQPVTTHNGESTSPVSPVRRKAPSIPNGVVVGNGNTREEFNDVKEQIEVVILETDDLNISAGRGDGEELVYVSKHKNYLGLDITGGRNDPNNTAIRVRRVVPGGAASDDSAIEVGKEITHVDGKSLLGLSRDEAESILQLSFSIKTPVNMELRLRPVMTQL